MHSNPPSAIAPSDASPSAVPPSTIVRTHEEFGAARPVPDVHTQFHTYFVKEIFSRVFLYFFHRQSFQKKTKQSQKKHVAVSLKATARKPPSPLYGVPNGIVVVPVATKFHAVAINQKSSVTGKLRHTVEMITSNVSFAYNGIRKIAHVFAGSPRLGCVPARCAEKSSNMSV